MHPTGVGVHRKGKHVAFGGEDHGGAEIRSVSVNIPQRERGIINKEDQSDQKRGMCNCP